MSDAPEFYISITGLELKGWRQIPRFWWHAIASARQARRTEGNISVQFATISGVKHTLTVWESESAMKRFLYRGAHRRAIANFDTIATGKTYGYSSSKIPDWEEARALWEAHGKEYVSR